MSEEDRKHRDPDNLGYKVGVRVRLDGIGSKPAYNGTFGKIVAWDKKNDRWKVKIDVDKSTKAMKNKNLTPVDADGNVLPPPGG